MKFLGDNVQIKIIYFILLVNMKCLSSFSNFQKGYRTGLRLLSTSEIGNFIPEQGSTLNIKGLRTEIQRQNYRLIKKITSYNERFQKGEEAQAQSMDTETYTNRLKSLRELDEILAEVKSPKSERFSEALSLVKELGISDIPPAKQERGAKKEKGKPQSPRNPYYAYTSLEGIPIRVGRSASDNDELSINPEHRDSPDWWMHVSGAPGSHVVIRCHDNELPVKHRETLIDAAVLTAQYSKASGSGNVAVTYTRCRNVSKPLGAKPGLVRLSGEVATVTVNLKAEAKRLERLTATKT